MQDVKQTDGVAGHEIAGHETNGLSDIARSQKKLACHRAFLPPKMSLNFSIIIIIYRQFLTRRNTTKSLQGRASTQLLMTCRTEIMQCLDTYQLGAVSGERLD